MKTTLQFRIPADEFEAFKTEASLSDTSMSAMLEEGINKITDNPDLLANVIKVFLAEAGLSNGEEET